MKKDIYIILENIRSAFNVGSFFRTSDAAQVKKIYMTGFTPVPENCEKIIKTSLGAEKSVPYAFRKDPVSLIRSLQKKGVFVFAVETGKGSKNIFTVEKNPPLALVFGHEIDGVSPAVLRAVDEKIFIPMQGKKESLNVSVCGGIAIFEFWRKANVAINPLLNSSPHISQNHV